MTRSPLTWAALLAVTAGGIVGALLRWLLESWVPDGGFPTTTFAINVVGSFALALLPGLVAAHRHPLATVALGPGLLGGFTTLSAVAVEAQTDLVEHHPGQAAVYLAATLAASLAVVALGRRLTTPAEVEALEQEGGET